MIPTKEQLQRVISEYFAGKPVMKAWLFGSYARGEADENSDVDVLIELDYSQKPGLNFYRWPNELSEMIHKKVDVVSERGLSKYIRPYVEKDKELIYAQ